VMPGPLGIFVSTLMFDMYAPPQGCDQILRGIA
jgi:hypothetical protein